MPKFLPKIFGTVGLILMLLGVYFGYSSYLLSSEGITVSGEVVENVEVESEYSEDGYTKTRLLYHPRVKFEDESGEAVIFLSDTGSGRPTYQPGERIDVIHPPGKPKQAQVKSSIWMGMIICLGLASVFLVFAFLFHRFGNED